MRRDWKWWTRVIAGVFAVHLAWYGFSGVPFWAPIGDDLGRGFALFFLHLGVFIAAFVSIVID